MHKRSITKYRPGVERLEEKRPLSVGASTAPLEHLKHRAPVPGHGASPGQGDATSQVEAQGTVSAEAINTQRGFLVYRITQPNRFNNHIKLPISGHVLVQNRPP